MSLAVLVALAAGYLTYDAVVAVVAPPPGSVVITYEQRLSLIDEAWESGPRLRSGASPCPTVRALEMALPELRGVDRRERDYVAMLRGEEC